MVVSKHWGSFWGGLYNKGSVLRPETLNLNSAERDNIL